MSMMHFALFGTLIVSVLIQFLLVAGFVKCLRGKRQQLIDDTACPNALVVLCLRGGDPFLSKCVRGLITQNYPNYQVRFVVDNADDPAMPIIRNVLSGNAFKNYQIEVLASPSRNCSLKCSSLVQALERVPESIEIIALLDADTIPHSTWLRELATALVPKNVGAATGNRWYMPTQCSLGSITRYAWNAAAVVQMYWYDIAWGGTLAIKLDSIRRSGILERWRMAYCEDTMVRRQLSTIGQKVVFVPTLMMINREDCTVAAFHGWVKRQLLAARLYHPFWFLVVGHGISSAALILWGLMSCVWFLMQGDIVGAGWVCFALLAFHTCLACMLPWMERAVFDIAKARGEDVSWPGKSNCLTIFWISWQTQWVYVWALLGCLFLKQFNWRGIEYTVGGPWEITMLGYRPYSNERAGHDQTQQSI